MGHKSPLPLNIAIKLAVFNLHRLRKEFFRKKLKFFISESKGIIFTPE